MNTTTSPHVQAFFDPATWTVSYVVYDHPGGHAAVVDSVLDYDPRSGRTRTDSADRLLAHLAEQNLKLQWILETHAHADHLSAAHYLRQRVGGSIAIGAAITDVQKVFQGVFHLEPEFHPDGQQFDRLLHDGEHFAVGDLRATALAVPGHTPACMAFHVHGVSEDGSDSAVFVGDTLFLPDVGTARCDFPGGNAHTLYRSTRRLLALPAATRLFMCHDYPPERPGGSRAVAWECTVADQRAHNIHVHDGVSEDEFVAMRTARDATLAMPVLILPSVQVNIRAGELPPAEANGVRYLKIPLNAL